MNALQAFTSLSPVRRQKIINGIKFPDANNRGRCFPPDETEGSSSPDFVGPAIVGDAKYRVAVWVNYTTGDRPYLRLVFEPFTTQEAT